MNGSWFLQVQIDSTKAFVALKGEVSSNLG